MRILLDTNIFIYREDDHVLSDNLQELLRILNEIDAQIIIHPLSSKDLARDADVRRKEIMKSKLGTYPVLDSPPKPNNDPQYLSVIEKGIHNVNDDVDDNILYSVYKDAVDFLITEDRGIHKKAGWLAIGDRVLLIDEALIIFENYISKEGVIIPPPLKNEPVYGLNLDDPIFNTLKEEYHPEFEDWFTKIKKEGRKCWVYYRNDGSIGALLIYKFEDESINNSNPPLPRKRRLKIATMKVTHVGYKIGELFIKMATDMAIRNDIFEIYLTHYTKPQDRLVELISEYGFEKVAIKNDGEDIFAKRLIADPSKAMSLSPIDLSKKYYPSFYDGMNVKKFIVPIIPIYHDRLFTDFRIRQTTLFEHFGDFIVEGNTIRKAYLSHSNIKKMTPGDILLFYRSKDMHAITSIGIAEDIHIGIEDASQILKLVGKRTVFSLKEIDKWVKKPVSVFLFRHHLHLKKILRLDKLIDSNVLKNAPQTIGELPTENYIKIKEMGVIDERFTVN